MFAVGVSNLQFVDLNSGRNLFIYGFSVLMGMGFSKWFHSNPNTIKTGEYSY